MTYVELNKIEEKLVRDGNKRDAFESLFARFNRQVAISGVFRVLKRYESYEKPSDKRRRKIRECKRRVARREGKSNAVHSAKRKGQN